MRYRQFGRAGFQVSEVGFGAWGIGGGWGERDDAQALRALHKAIDLGVRFIDTAMAYGDGHSEQLIGQVLKERSERIYVATKISPKNRIWTPPTGTLQDSFPKEYIIDCTEASLRRLGVDCIDVQQLHTWTDRWVDDDEWKEAAHILKEQGKIRAFGVSVDHHQPDSCLQALRTGELDSVQVIYNIFDQSPEERLFPLAQELNVAIIVRVPLDEGGLTGAITPDTEFEPGDWRKGYFRGERKGEVYERVKKLEFLIHGDVADLPEAALRFTLSHPAVTAVIPGMRKVRHVEANCAASDKGPLPRGDLARLKEHAWPRNFYIGAWD